MHARASSSCLKGRLILDHVADRLACESCQSRLRRRLREWWNSSAVSIQHGRDGFRDVYPNRMNALASLESLD